MFTPSQVAQDRQRTTDVAAVVRMQGIQAAAVAAAASLESCQLLN